MVGVGFGLGVGDGEGLGLGVGLGDGEGEGIGLGDGVGVGVLDGVGEGDNVGVGESVGIGVFVGVTVGVLLGVIAGALLGAMVGALDGVGGIAGGSISDAVFCGCGVFRTTKSFALLSVSSPLPANSSAPPTVIVVEVDVENAFLSILLFVTKAGASVVSLSIANPIPTLSTTVCPVSLYTRIVLLLAMPLELA